MRIEQKVIVITGGASGLGLATTRYMVQEKGARVAIFDMNAEAGVKAVVPDRSAFSNKWRLECSGGADADGQIVLHITPKDGTQQVVTVPVSRGTGENAVARTIRDALRAQLGTKAFNVETDDGEDVLVKRRGKTPDFAMKIAENTVKGVRLNLD